MSVGRIDESVFLSLFGLTVIHFFSPFLLSYNVIILRSDAYPRAVCAHLVGGLDKFNEMFCQNLLLIRKMNETA